jgi:hypothetical protein
MVMGQPTLRFDVNGCDSSFAFAKAKGTLAALAHPRLEVR